MAKNTVKLIIYSITTYRDVPIIVQGYGDFFQSVYQYKGNFYQAHNIFTPQKKRHTNEDIKKIVTWQLNLAMEAIDYLIDPERMVNNNIDKENNVKKLVN